MSRHRARPDRGYVSAASLPRGPNGRACCRYCGQEVPPGKRTFCGELCVHEWKVRSNPGYARKQVFKRDKGRCAECNEPRFTGTFRNHRGVVVEYSSAVPIWEMDHILPVSEGGGECGLDGLRTLCQPCHKRATAALAARRAAARKLA